MRIIKLIFEDRIGYTTGDPDALILNKKKAKEYEEFDVPQETFDMVMNDPDKWELVTAPNVQGFKLKERK